MYKNINMKHLFNIFNIHYWKHKVIYIDVYQYDKKIKVPLFTRKCLLTGKVEIATFPLSNGNLYWRNPSDRHIIYLKKEKIIK